MHFQTGELPLNLCNKAHPFLNIFGYFIFLEAMGQTVASTALSMIREVVFGVGFALLLPISFGLNGVLYSMPLSDLLTFFVTVFLIGRTDRQLRQTA